MNMHVKNTASSCSNFIDFFHRPNYSGAMKRLQAYRFELKISPSQTQQLYKIAGSCRYVYNKALVLQKSRYEEGLKKLNYAGLCRELTVWRNDPKTAWLRACPSQALQQSLKDLERAYQNFFQKRADYPQRKRRGVKDAFRYPQGVKLDQPNARVFLPKLGWTRYRKSREVLGELSNVTISRHCDKWYVSIQTEYEAKEAVHPSKTAIGVDVGIAQFATLSDGIFFEGVNSFKHHQHSLAACQRRLSKKKKFSQNWKKTVFKLGRLHRKLAHVRQDYLHKVTHAISKNHAMVCIEDLQVKQMSKSAKGTLAFPGKGVKAKSGLNRSILDQGWREFRRQLEYKQDWRGGLVVVVPPHYTSQTCPVCSHVDAGNRPTQAHFKCLSCAYENNADRVAAMNILRAGHAQLACGELARLGHSVNQEPAEAVQVKVA